MRFNQYITEKSDYTIYVDMDGVISDFVTHVEQSFGVSFNTLLADDNEFWRLIHEKGEKYWLDMPMMSDAKKLMGYIKNKNVKILSSAGSPKNAKKFIISGKMKWMTKYFPNVPVIIEYDKSKYADERSILIDDLTKNIKPWVKAGGIGILHKSAADTIKQLKSYGI